MRDAWLTVWLVWETAYCLFFSVGLAIVITECMRG
jgi:hypothetical protein